MVNYTSAEKVLTQLPATIRENESKTRILSWIYQGYQGLNIPQENQQKCCLYTVKNHKTQLCSDIKNIVSVTVYDESIPPFSLESYLEDTTNCNGDYILAHKVFLASNDYINSFIPLKYIGNSSYVDSSCCNLECNHCNHTFSVDQKRILSSSIKEGQFCVVYNSHVRDEEGNMMIVDVADVIEYLKSYVIREHLSDRVLREERVIGTLDREERKLNSLYRKARGEAILRSVNYKSLAELTTDSFNAILLKYNRG